MKTCLRLIGQFKLKCAFFNFQDFAYLFYIISFSYYNNKWNGLAEWRARMHMTSGTWVRIPGPPNKLFLFFLHTIVCRLQRIVHHIPPATSCHVATIINPMVRMEAHHILQSTNRHLIQKVNEGLMFLGLRFPNKPPFWAQNPPLVHSFFLFILYFLVYLLIIFSNYYYYH